MIAASLDHIAVAAERQADCWRRYVGELGGSWVGRGVTVGFSSAQVEYANGMRLEVLEPAHVDRNDFLRRFLDQRGPGAHHLTFKVPDLAAAIDELEGRGYDVVGVDVRDPFWKECFIHPKRAYGIVVQLAQSAGQWPAEPRPATLPTPVQPAADLDRVVQLVADLAAALDLYEGVLGGTRVGESDGADRWVDLRWPPAGIVRFEAATEEQQRRALDGADGRFGHLEMTVDDPTLVGGVVPDGEGWVLPSGDNLGIELRLNRRGRA